VDFGLFRGSIRTLLHERDCHEAIPPFFIHLEARVALSHQYLLNQGQSTGDVLVALSRSEPATVTAAPMARPIKVGRGFAFKA
jgi:hypothetical protein